MKNRSNNIEFRQYKSTPVKEKLYEIIKWQPNFYYNQYEKYLDNGYIETFSGDSITNGNHSIDKNCFFNPESCYVIGFIYLNKKEPCYYLETVGDRLCDLTDDEVLDFMKVYRKAMKKLNKKLNYD
ncbi:MAG: hypothetical protein EOL97_16275 [Spirochaetia bacterium]|nr:hypothetical protein [Spirochaetia bacterium]